MAKPLVLLVDDAPELGDVVSYLGRRSGLEVACCQDVFSGWAFVQTRRPELVLLDVNLPGISGLELCRRVRATPALADLRIAVFTSWGIPTDVAAGIEAGAEYVVSKDLISRPAEWHQRITEILATPNSQWDGDRVPCPEATHGSLPITWPDSVNRLLRSAAQRLIGQEVLQVVLRRALLKAAAATFSVAEIATWMTSDGLQLSSTPIHAALDVVAVAHLIASLADQLQRLLGAEASAPIRGPLVGIVPGLSTRLSH